MAGVDDEGFQKWTTRDGRREIQKEGWQARNGVKREDGACNEKEASKN